MENRYHKHQALNNLPLTKYLPFSLQVYKLYIENFLKGYASCGHKLLQAKL